jgi:short-subunit dehydrogenase
VAKLPLKRLKMNVIITGGTKGIGRAMAEKFAAEGYNIITCSRNVKELEELVHSFKEQFPKVSVQAKVADLENEDEVKNFGEWILANEISPDILINNAGYFIPGTIHEEQEGILQKMMATNVYSCYHLIRVLLPYMIKKGEGHIFNICSIASFKGLENVGSYGISKFALLGLTKHLREEMKPLGIKVTAVSPGATFSASWDGSGINAERIIDVKDIAEMVYAASQLSSRAVVEDIVIRPQLGDL